MPNQAKSFPPPAPDDNSSVRERSPSRPSIAPLSGSASATRDRLEAKLKTGRSVLAGLSASDDRARLLHVALMRRDEALLDGVLAALGVVAASIPPGR